MSMEMTETSDIGQEFTSFLELIYSRLLKPFEELFKGELTNLQIITLCALGRSGPVPVTELASRLRVTKQHMTKVIANLTEMGYVCKYPCSSDKRIVLVGLSEDTAAMLRERRSYFVDSMRELISQRLDEVRAREFLDNIDHLDRILESLPVGRCDDDPAQMHESKSSTKCV